MTRKAHGQTLIGQAVTALRNLAPTRESRREANRLAARLQEAAPVIVNALKRHQHDCDDCLDALIGLSVLEDDNE